MNFQETVAADFHFYPGAEITAQQTHELLENDEFVLIDVREQIENDFENIKGALHIPVSKFAMNRVREISVESKPIFFCRTGVRSAQILAKVASEGISAGHLEGGIVAWKSANLPVNKTGIGFGIDVMRQTQIMIGLLIVLCSSLAYSVNDIWNYGTGLIGLGLLVAGMTGYCGMSNLISLFPWNRRIIR
ncbi:MAG: DUF2892 domain-containing protein [Planctomycetia bacterium]|jgi:rhodanese-related sulfurtransferase|nr:DUF2892 domain-containing protein [Planctomycetia bacterium]